MKRGFIYTHCYCEENVYHMAKQLGGQVVFISNLTRQVLFKHHRKDEPVIWDYHVVLKVDGLIYDLDSLLPFPCPVSYYVEQTFGDKQRFQPMFRVIDAQLFLGHFKSDRSHMPEQNRPTYPCIGNGMNLFEYVDMQSTNDPACGQFLSQLI